MKTIKKLIKEFLPDWKKFTFVCILFLVIFSVLAVCYRLLDAWLFNFYPKPLSNENMSYVKDFNSYKDFVVIITGLLTCVIGFVAVGGYISFKNIKKEEKKIRKARRLFDLLIGLQISDRYNYDEDTEIKIKILEDLNFSTVKDSSLYVVKGDAFYYRGKTGDYHTAEKLYTEALNIDQKNPMAFFGLARASFKLNFSRELSRLKLDTDYLKETSRNVDVFEKNSQEGKKFISPLMIKENRDLSKICFKKSYLKNKKFDDIIIDFSLIQTFFEQAISNGYTEQLVWYELGQMYAQCYKFEEALFYYKKSYNKNKDNIRIGYYYAESFLMTNFTYKGDCLLQRKAIREIVQILHNVGMLVPELSNAAYALLWYLYIAKGDSIMGERVLQTTNEFVINDIFELKKEN